jgi:hypothetical protein
MGWDGTHGLATDMVGLRSGTTVQNFANNTWTVVSVSGTPSHDGGGITVASSVGTVPMDGVYLFDGYVRWDANATGRRIAAIEVYTGAAPTPGTGNVVDLIELGTVPAGTVFPTCSPRVEQFLAAGTQVRLIVFQTSGGVLGIRNDFSPARLGIRRVA